MREDLRWAIRYALRRPILALTVAATLVLTIATATIAFGLARAVLWRPLPFRDEVRLAFVWEEAVRDGRSYPSRVTGARFAAWRKAAAGTTSLALFGAAGFTTETPAGSVPVRGVRVSAGYFETLGIGPLLGRTFAPEDEQAGNHRVAILSNALWQESFGARRTVIGESIRLSGQPYTIVGVMPRETFPAWPVNPANVTLDPDSRQLWVPIPRTPELDNNARAHVFGVIARVAAGVSSAEAVERLTRSANPTSPDPHGARLQPIREQFVQSARPQLLALAATAVALLLVACTNVAALYLSAFESRRAEFAIRVAIGASLTRLVRQLVMEAAMLAAVGAVGGIAVARAALGSIPGLLPPTVPFLTTPTVDLPVALFALGLATFASASLTGWPIIRLVAASPMPRGAAVLPRRDVYRALVVCEVAFTVALVVAAALLGRSLRTVRHRETGFAVDHVLVADVGLPAALSTDPNHVALAERELLAAVAARPGVRSAAASYDHPLEANWSETLTVLGDTVAEQQRQQVELRIVSPEYFDALDVEVVDGRAFTMRDTLERPGVAVVNEALALAIGGRVLGRRIRSAAPRLTYGNAAPEEFEIVGVVRNERFRGLEQPAQPAYYLSTGQFPQTVFSILVRTFGDPVLAAAGVRSAARAANGATTVDRTTTLERILSDQLAERRVTTEVISGFALGALALAALGVYGLLAILVGSRTREIGVRLAIGASPAALAREVIGEALRNTMTGVVLGSLLALAVGSILQRLLVGVSSRDPLTLAAVGGVLLSVAALAAAIPAYRASRVDPLTALRAE